VVFLGGGQDHLNGWFLELLRVRSRPVQQLKKKKSQILIRYNVTGEMQEEKKQGCRRRSASLPGSMAEAERKVLRKRGKILPTEEKGEIRQKVLRRGEKTSGCSGDVCPGPQYPGLGNKKVIPLTHCRKGELQEELVE